MALTKNQKNLRQERVRMELKVKILKLLDNFESEEEPTYKKLTQEDVINVLSSMIERKTQ